MYARITFLPSLIVEQCFVKAMKNFEPFTDRHFSKLNRSASFKSLFSGFVLNVVEDS